MSLDDYITRPPLPFMVIQDKKQLKAYTDSKLSVVLQILLNGPMTVSDVVFAYNKNETTPKSEVSIYNYLKKLEDAGLVIIAGRRVSRGHTSAQILYARSALVMLPLSLASKKYWDTNESDEVIDITKQIISLYTQQEEPSSKNLKNLLFTVYSNAITDLQGFIEKNQRALNKIIKDNSVEEIRLLVNMLTNIMIIFNSERYEKEMKQSFPNQ